MWIAPKLYLDQLKLIGSWFPKRFANFYSVLSRENKGTLCSGSLCVANTIFWIVCFEAVMRGLQVLFLTIDQQVRMPEELDFRLITTSKNSLSEIRISRLTAWDSPSVPLISLVWFVFGFCSSYLTWQVSFACNSSLITIHLRCYELTTSHSV